MQLPPSFESAAPGCSISSVSCWPAQEAVKACRHAQCKALPDSDHVLRCQAPEVRGSPDLPAMLAPTLGSSRFAGSTCPLHSAPVSSRPHRLLPQRIECKESRVGRAPIAIPSGVNVTNSGLTYTVKVSHIRTVASGASVQRLYCSLRAAASSHLSHGTCVCRGLRESWRGPSHPWSE